MTVDLNYYFDVYGGNVLQNNDDAVKSLKLAYRQIDLFCRGRLLKGAADAFDEDIQNKIKNIICEQADFNVSNADLINSALQKYTINGVSIEYATNQQIKNVNGVMTKSYLYDELALLGLTYRGL